MDSCFIRAIRHLHSISSDSQNNLRAMLDESIKNKYGSGKEIGQFVNFSSVFQEYPVLSAGPIVSDIGKDDGKGGSSSDNELELDLLKEDLMCVICKGMSVGARNRLVECCECNSLYHQECHDPSITEEEIEPNSFWTCVACKEATKAVRKPSLQPTSLSSHKTLVPSSSITQSHRVFSEKEYCDMNASKQNSSSKVSAGPSNKSSVPQNRIMTPNINIISADKRLQIMKKKAAKLQEKRKLSR